MPLISIIIPVYRVEQYLPQCIDSVLQQTHRNLQVILVDDGSPDGCGAICDGYARKESRVLALHKENGGVSSARNYGLKYAQGKYVTFCDSDDLYTPDWIEKLVQAAEKHQADIAIGNYIRFFEDGSSGKGSAHETGLVEISRERDRIRYIFDKVFTPKHAWEVCMRLFRMDIIRAENIRFCENCGNYAEDFGFTLAYTLYARRVVSIPDVGYRYRVRSGSMMQSSAWNPKLDSIQAACAFCLPNIRAVLEPEVAERFYRDMRFYLLGNQFSSCLWASGMNPEEFRDMTIQGCSDWPAMKKQIAELLEKKRDLGRFCLPSQRAELISHLEFLLGMSWLQLRLRCKLIRMVRPLLDGHRESM